MKIINECRLCRGRQLEQFFDLGVQPLANSLLKSPSQLEKLYPLSLSFCHDCKLVQLNQTIDPAELFCKYVWLTGTSKGARTYALGFCKDVLARINNLKKGYILEVGSNDGTVLLQFIRHGFNVLGVDPARNVVEIATKRGVPTECVFFGTSMAKELLNKYGSAQVVIARNVLPHVADTRDFVAGLGKMLDESGLLVIEVHYAKKILEEIQYDSIYHEHLCYFTCHSLEQLLEDCGLSIFDISEGPISGGSIVVYATKYKTDRTVNIQRYKEQEIKDKTNEFNSWRDFANKSHHHSVLLQEMLYQTSKRDVIVGYGASARSSTLLNFCGITSKTIKMIADQNPLKQGRYTTGSHILIDSPARVMRQKPDDVLILAWNFAEEIIGSLQNKYGYHGGVFLPLPNKPQLISL